MKGTPVMELAGAGVIESEEGEADMIDEDQLLDAGQVQSAETYRDVKVSEELSKKQRSEVYKLLYRYRDVFTERPGTTSLVEHKIEMVGDSRSKSYPIPYNLRDFLREDMEKMIEMGVIRKSDSPCSSPIVIVRKKDGTDRICVDFRQMNKVTEFDSEPMVKPQDIFESISKNKIFSKFDMTKVIGKFLCKNRTAKTSFIPPGGCYEFVKMQHSLE